MTTQVTTTDIANKLGISRGTVSKALNGKDRINEKTRLLIQKTAYEMGYKKSSSPVYPIQKEHPSVANNIVSIMMRESQVGGAYWTTFIKSCEEAATEKHYRLTTNIISNDDENVLQLPRSFEPHPPAGIITIGPISKAYYQLLQASKIPCVFIDTVAFINDSQIFGDTLLMCNKEYVYEMTCHLIKQGHTQIGFISSNDDCRSFQDRKEGFCAALADNSLPVLDEFVYTAEIKELRAWISSLKKFPTAFVCSNDLYALLVQTALKEIGMDVPKDIAICGFDNDPGFSLLFPELTTVDGHVQYVGARAIQKLFWRMANPNAPYEMVKITSQIYYRNSTEGYVFRK